VRKRVTQWHAKKVKKTKTKLVGMHVDELPR
jgi:hypothetical protein